MGRPQRRKRMHKNNKGFKKSHRTKRRTKDIDQIVQDLTPENKKKLMNQEVDIDKPGFGQHYCIECSKYFISEDAKQKHIKSKVHKKRLKQLKDPYEGPLVLYDTSYKNKVKNNNNNNNNNEEIETINME
eukprot:TRINITY_DN19659_c1_g1_i1.p1 TRINITY_DN19659_c1_g1~~TRINITY_DN19659_c1_g1_i1.p1  ORF type:complete len:130 (+),score=36.66 TRINITY_DN19659_c1_g1_i1:50-439(+)